MVSRDCLLLLLLCSLSNLGYAQFHPLCGLQDYNTSVLKAKYWKVDIQKHTTLTQLTCPGWESGNKNCTVYFSFCQPLPNKTSTASENVQEASACNHYKAFGLNASMCTVIDGNLTSPKPYGAYSPALNPFIKGDPIDGQRTFLANYSEGGKFFGCTGMNTEVTFLCDSNADWTQRIAVNGIADVTPYLESAERNPIIVHPCMYLMKFRYIGACPSCSLTGYDTSVLKKKFWKVDIQKSKIPLSSFSCPGYVKGDTTCTLYFSFCQSLPNITTVADLKEASSCNQYSGYNSSASICAVINSNINSPKLYATYNASQVPFKEEKPIDGKTAFFTSYRENEFMVGNCKEIKTLITFLCDSTANWNERIVVNDVADATPYLNDAILDNLASPCLYILEFRYSGACGPVPIVAPTSSPAGIDPGWILIIIFICVVILYLAVGSIVNVALGKRTPTEIFPNYSLWIKFILLIVDGFRFSLNAITCFQCAKFSKGPTKYEEL